MRPSRPSTELATKRAALMSVVSEPGIVEDIKGSEG
jgi:hypothetical protein